MLLPASSSTSSLPSGNSYSLSTTRYSLLLLSYFRSGWAFLIPYLAAYLLYAWLKWPVNPGGAGGMVQGAKSWVPCLLHVYWVLHAIHLVLGVIALCEWWKSPVNSERRTDDSVNAPNRAPPPQPSTVPHSGNRLPETVYRLLPWIFLGLLFYIPGIYLEWPSDPWEHLRRINEWHNTQEVTAHSSWKKSSYFLPYSLTGHTTGLSQLSWLNFYYTGVCLLLSWQYYRLARAVGLGERTSFIFVLLNTLTFGNNVFSFYRYYGLSSSIFAQLGAIALTRLAIEAARRNIAKGGGSRESACPLSLPSVLHSPRSFLLQSTSGFALCALIAFNHIQGLAIAGLGILAVVVWRLIEWRRTMIFWLVGAAVALSISTVLWFPRHPVIDGIYRPAGWLTDWYAFNLLSLGSPAFARSMQILGFTGTLGIFAGSWLMIRKNSVVGWLTLMPVGVLALPCFALPLANLWASGPNSENIIVFHRFLFAVPAGLALVVGVTQLIASKTFTSKPKIASQTIEIVSGTFPITRQLLFGGALVCMVTLSPSHSSYNRLWSNLYIPPDDLQLKHLAKREVSEYSPPDTLVISTPLVSDLRNIFWPELSRKSSRQAGVPFFISEHIQQVELLSTMSDIFHRQPLYECDQVLLNRQESTYTEGRVIAALTTTSTPWITLGGILPQQTMLATKRYSIRNQAGSVCYPFSPDLISISRGRRYQLSCSIRQTNVAEGINYLAIAWYDREGNLLVSNTPFPVGAGNPTGWHNGTFSYFGLVGMPADPEWTNYSVSFGFGATAAIPANASFLRVGALLNYTGLERTQTELTDVVLIENDFPHKLLITAPCFWHLLTTASQAAWLSGHWMPQHVPVIHTGARELRAHF